MGRIAMSSGAAIVLVAVALTAAQNRLFVAAGGNRLTRTAHIATAAGARTSLFAREQNRLFPAVPHRGNQKAEIRVYATREIG